MTSFGYSLGAVSSAFCSLWLFGSLPSPTTALLVATATPDTVATGVGPFEYSKVPGHFGTPVERDVFGQRFTLDRVDVRTGNALVFAGERRDVILVPWDYDPACRPTLWSGSWRWVSPGTRGFFYAELRAREQWVSDMPTFDVRTAAYYPYPHAPGLRWDHYFEAADSYASAFDLFDALTALPSRDDVKTDPAAAWRAAQQWVELHPDIGRRYPVERILAWIRDQRLRDRIRSERSPLAGTYRLRVLLPAADPMTLFMRAAAHAEWPIYNDSIDAPAWARASYVGNTIPVAIAPSIEDLPDDEETAANSCGASGLRVLFPDDSELISRAAALSLNFLFRCFPALVAVARFDERYDALWRERIRMDGASARTEYYEARFDLQADGTVRFHQRIEAPSGVLIEITGERIDDTALAR